MNFVPLTVKAWPPPNSPPTLHSASNSKAVARAKLLARHPIADERAIHGSLVAGHQRRPTTTEEEGEASRPTLLPFLQGRRRHCRELRSHPFRLSRVRERLWIRR